jgi:hypothetical protein
LGIGPDLAYRESGKRIFKAQGVGWLSPSEEGIVMEKADVNTSVKNERLAVIVERCLESPAAYKLFDMLSAIAQLDLDAKVEYVAMVRESGAYTDEEIGAIERLIISGAAQYFKDVIDQVREEQVQREIADMLAV